MKQLLIVMFLSVLSIAGAANAMDSFTPSKNQIVMNDAEGDKHEGEEGHDDEHKDGEHEDEHKGE